MALTSQQIEQVRAATAHLVDASARSQYTYDLNYSKTYMPEVVAAILSEADLGLNLTQDDLKDLSEAGKFSISKTTLVRLGTRLLSRPDPTISDATKFATLVLLWGYASQGYGPYRVKRILAGGGAQLGANTLGSLKALQSGDVASAYAHWLGSKHVNRIGESFFTKILYFLAKGISPHNPIAIIKDSITSRNAATLFDIKHLVDRGTSNYLDYVEALNVVAQVAQITKEKVEEALFSTAPATLQVDQTPDRVIETGFAYAQDQQIDFAPPVLTDGEYQEATIGDDGVYRIMLVADGKPECGDLPAMCYRSAAKPILDGFYTKEREDVIKKANEEANKCRPGTPTYVMTTGFGAVPVTMSLNLYNVPGKRAIQVKSYWELYKQSLLQILPLAQTVAKVVIVYYAGKSEQPFRKRVFDILKELRDSPDIARRFRIQVCMFGTRQHSGHSWSDSICRIFDALSGGDESRLKEIKAKWESQQSQANHPFFQCF